MSALTILDAPSNLGLRPLLEGSVPGCFKAPWALREAGLFEGLDVREAGVVVPPRYEAAWTAGAGVRNGAALAVYSRRLADRLGQLLGDGFVVVLGGDCAVLIGEALALRRRGRFGLAFLDGHGDFRHEGNSDAVVAAAGEDLAIVTGRGDARLIDLDGLGPSTRGTDVVAIGLRDDDPYLAELEAAGVKTWPMARVADAGIETVAAGALRRLTASTLDGFWVHLDVDVLDAEIMPAVDSPAPGGLRFEELERLLGVLVEHPAALGMDICIFDPDLDPDGVHAERLAACLRGALSRRVAGSR